MSVDHYENFPVASLLCPPELRPAVAAIYWFARTADDLADEGDCPPEQRLMALRAYRQDLHAVAAQRPASTRWTHVFDPLQRTLRQRHLPVALLEDLLDAFEQDVRQGSYAERVELLAYCRRSANPIGRLLLHLYGIRDPLLLQQSDHICTALQLINFWQDLSIDTSRGRLYLPQADCHRHGVTAESLRAGLDTPNTRALVEEVVHWARQMMQAGAPLALALPGRSGWELRLVVQGGLRILEKIEHIGYRSLQVRPTLRWHDIPLLAWRAMRMKASAASSLHEARP